MTYHDEFKEIFGNLHVFYSFQKPQSNLTLKPKITTIFIFRFNYSKSAFYPLF